MRGIEHGNAKYDWDRWLRRKRFTLRRGVDYQGSAVHLCQQVRNAACTRGLHVSVKESDGDIVVTRAGSRPLFKEEG